jgi:hypothetical protein
VGSYVVAINRSTPLVDPGSEVYTRRTFSADRYKSNVLNSFGHDVPRVAGQLQATGRQAAAKVLKTEFTDERDTFVIDLTACYPVKSLKTLTRTFVFSREGRGSLVITDAVEFTKPEAFGTAIITFDKWKQIDASSLQIGEGHDAVTAQIQTEGGDIRIVPEEIHEDLPQHRVPIRLGIELTKPTTKASITARISAE